LVAGFIVGSITGNLPGGLSIGEGFLSGVAIALLTIYGSALVVGYVRMQKGREGAAEEKPPPATAPRAQEEHQLYREQQFGWRPTRRQLLWAAAIIGVVALFLLLIGLGYAYRWTGFGQYKVDGEVQPAKSLWDWLSLLIIPIVLAIGGYWFNHSENSRSQDMAAKRAESDQQIAEQRRHDDALQAYLDNIGELLLHKDQPLRRSKEGDEVQTIARARTLTVLHSWLARLGDEDRKRSVLQFLYESKLISKDRPVVDLRDTNLMGAYLTYINLSAADLSGAWLSDAKLYRANLNEANLRGADLSDADLGATNLSDSEITGEQLARVKSLEGATMPDGQNYEDWLKTSEGKKYQDLRKQYEDDLGI